MGTNRTYRMACKEDTQNEFWTLVTACWTLNKIVVDFYVSNVVSYSKVFNALYYIIRNCWENVSLFCNFLND